MATGVVMVSGSHIALYLLVISGEGALVFGVRALAAPDGRSLRELLGRRPTAADLLIAAATWVAWVGTLHLLNGWLPPSTTRVAEAMLPVGRVEPTVWILLSISAGIAEELAFRGYLQRKVGVVAQAIVFGIVHGYQGIYAIARITVYGLLLGLVARWRASLAPGMIVHAWTDIAAGILRR
jgi:membrane protease YdiL (CAAX protease family)